GPATTEDACRRRMLAGFESRRLHHTTLAREIIARKGGMTMYDLRVLSLGAGVQSTALALMAAHGEFEQKPDCAIFADTGWEPRDVYEHLDRLERELPFPLYRVSAGNIREDALAPKNGKRFVTMPLHVRNLNGKPAILRR